MKFPRTYIPRGCVFADQFTIDTVINDVILSKKEFKWQKE